MKHQAKHKTNHAMDFNTAKKIVVKSAFDKKVLDLNATLLAFKLACVGVFSVAFATFANANPQAQDLQIAEEVEKKPAKDSTRIGICGKKTLLDEVRLNIKNNLIQLKAAHLLENGSVPFPISEESKIKRLRAKDMGCKLGNYADSAKCLYDKIKDEKQKAEFGAFAKRLHKVNISFDTEMMSRDTCSVRAITIIFEGGDRAKYTQVDIGYLPKAYNDKTLEIVTFGVNGQIPYLNTSFVPLATILADMDKYYNGRGILINNSLKGACPNGAYTYLVNPKDKLSKVYNCAGGLFRNGVAKEIAKEKTKEGERDNIVAVHYSQSGGVLIKRKYALTKYIDEQRYNSIGQNTELYTKAYQKASQRIKPPTPSKAEKDLERFKEQAINALEPNNAAQSVFDKLTDDEWQAYQAVQDYNAKKTTKAPDEKTLKLAKSYQQKEEKQQKQLAEMMKVSQEWNSKILAYKQKLEEETKKEYTKMIESYQEPRIDTEEQILAFVKKENIEPIYESVETADLKIIDGEQFFAKCEAIEEACNAKFKTGCKIIGKKCGVMWNNNAPIKGLGDEYKEKYKELIDKSYFKDSINAKLDSLNPPKESKPDEKDEKNSKDTKESPKTPKSAPAPQEQILQPIDILRF